MVTPRDIAGFRAHLRTVALEPKKYWSGERGQLAHLPRHKNHDEFLNEVLKGLQKTPKTISPKFFYDVEGSRLFEQITQQEEYYLTRAEYSLLRDNARRICEELGTQRTWVELGSGSSQKTRQLLQEWCRRVDIAHYVPVDISRTALTHSVPSLLNDFAVLWVTALQAEYEGVLKLLQGRELGLPVSLLFLGSNIGNFNRQDRQIFLREMVAALGEGSTFAFGADLEKDRHILEAAYNDSAGVTARFNRNILYHLKRELGVRVEPEQFLHRAFYNETEGRIEMHLVSERDQVISVGPQEIMLAAGEAIHTENSYKFRIPDLTLVLEASGMQVIDIIKDSSGLFSFWICSPSPSSPTS